MQVTGSIPVDMIFRWMLIGFVCAFALKDLQERLHTGSIHLKAAAIMAITLSLALLFLLFVGAENTFVAILSFGMGILFQLVFFALYIRVHNFFFLLRIKRKELHL